MDSLLPSFVLVSVLVSGAVQSAVLCSFPDRYHPQEPTTAKYGKLEWAGSSLGRFALAPGSLVGIVTKVSQCRLAFHPGPARQSFRQPYSYGDACPHSYHTYLLLIPSPPNPSGTFSWILLSAHSVILTHHECWACSRAIGGHCTPLRRYMDQQGHQNQVSYHIHSSTVFRILASRLPKLARVGIFKPNIQGWPAECPVMLPVTTGLR